jgi:membrane protease YdiL (CAAX protease family)
MKPTEKIKHATILVASLLLPTLITWIYFVVNKDSLPIVQQIAYGTGKVVQFLLPIVVVWLATDRKFSFHWPRKSGMLWGIVFGLLVVALMFGIYFFRMAEHPMLDPLKANVLDKVSGFGVNEPWKFLIMGLWYAIFHSLFEEYYWRWFVFPQCERFFSLWPAIIISSMGFMLHHILVLGFYLGWDSWFTYQVSFCIAVGGAFWAWLFRKSESLYPAWLSHGIVDAGIFFLGYLIVADSL